MILIQTPPPSPVVGDTAPDVVFRNADGKSVPLKSLKGKIVVLEFTSLYCASCRELAPRLEELAAKRTDVLFLTVSVDAPPESAKLLTLRGKDARTVFLQDVYSKDRSKMAVWKFGNVAVPTMFVIGPNGRLASRLIQGGVQDIPRLLERIAWARAHSG